MPESLTFLMGKHPAGLPAARIQARNSRGPGSHSGGTVFAAPRVHSLAIERSRASTSVRTSGVCSSVWVISGVNPASSIIWPSAAARQA